MTRLRTVAGFADAVVLAAGGSVRMNGFDKTDDGAWPLATSGLVDAVANAARKPAAADLTMR
jgi:CTP:molybdopterin cytidylyltransferase MocA